MHVILGFLFDQFVQMPILRSNIFRKTVFKKKIIAVESITNYDFKNGDPLLSTADGGRSLESCGRFQLLILL